MSQIASLESPAFSPVNDSLGELVSRTRLLRSGGEGPRDRGKLSLFWQGLVEGELHVVSASLEDGRCVAIAGTCVRGALSERERTLLRRGFLAEPQKVLAADLGVSGTTVSVLIGRALRKLGLERRMGAAPLAVVLSALHHFGAASVQDVRADTFEADGRHYVALSMPALDPAVLSGLTEAERNVALLLATGLNQHDIGTQRGTSASTIANQIAAVSRKLSIGGRFALIRRWAELQWQGEPVPVPPSAPAAAAAPAYLQAGERMAERYEVLGVQGRGGMGIVYRCRDLKTDELVAVKRVIPPAPQADEYLQWFVAESQALSGVDHEHVVRAREFGQLRDGTAYLAMDLVEGVTLEDIAARALPFPLVWILVDQILSALVHTHARGVVHGDLKPLNVMVATDASGGPHGYLFDFGLAKLRGSRLDPRLGQRAVAAEPPLRAGTPGYMAPEQILGRSDEISGATDLYALGCVIYCLLSGSAPYPNVPACELSSATFSPPARLLPTSAVPEGLVDFAMRLLERRPRERAVSTAAARDEWQRFRPALSEVPAHWAETLGRIAATAIAAAPADEALAVEARPHAASELARASTWLPGLLGVRPSPFVGRAQLTRTLAGVFDSVAQAEAPFVRAVLLSGPRGIGKSRLAEWLCTDVEERGAGLALRGYCSPDAPQSDSLTLALGQHLGKGGNRAAIRTALDERCFCSADELALAASWIHDGGSSEDASASPALGPAVIQRLIQQLAGRRPLVLWLDELTALSAETLAWLAALPEQRPPLRILLVATLRPDTLAVPRTARAVALLRDNWQALTLQVGPLDTLTTSALLSAALPLGSNLALKLALQSGGNPLAALERLCTAARRGPLV